MKLGTLRLRLNAAADRLPPSPAGKHIVTFVILADRPDDPKMGVVETLSESASAVLRVECVDPRSHRPGEEPVGEWWLRLHGFLPEPQDSLRDKSDSESYTAESRGGQD
jgi:hypothetical protein